MFARRQLLGTSAAAGLLGVISPDVSAEQASDRAIEEVRAAIDDLRKAFVRSRSFDEIAAVREQQRTFLRGSGKFPDFIEVGTDVWFAIYDLHVVWQQPLEINRDGAGRYTIKLVATTVVLRPDLLGSYIGAPYDLKG